MRRAMLAGVIISLAAGPALANPTGVFLWYPDQSSAPTTRDCDVLVARVQPSVEKAQAWLWGRAPFGSELEFYVFVTEDRMEPTFAAEGDFDFGDLQLLDTVGDETAFELVPDDHPDLTIAGTILAPRNSPVVTITLRNVQTNGGREDRTTYYCRFTEEAEI